MCHICDGAPERSYNESPCPQGLERLGFLLQQTWGEGSASLDAMRMSGALPMIPPQNREMWERLDIGISRGRTEDAKRSERRRWRGIVLSVGLTLLGIAAGAAISYGMPQIFGPIC